MVTTRYPGVTSFPDSELAYQLFFGREEDAQKLFYFILSETLTVLYSKSGYGKTSLLQAGVFKLLRQENYYPISIRLNKKENSPQEILKQEITDINKLTGFEAILPKANTLPEIFSGVEIWSPANKLLTPVVILDQFEEIFTLEHNQKYQSALINELGEVLSTIKDSKWNVKFVISIREDFLGHLEKLAVKIPSIFSNRFRLEALDPNEAQNSIEKPAKIELPDIAFQSPKIEFTPEAMEALIRFLSLKITEGVWKETDEIEPVQLQIICSELEKRAITAKEKNERDVYIITKDDLGGDEGLREILGEFYDNQIRRVVDENKLSPEQTRAVRNIIEKELIVGKRRVPLSYDTIVSRENISKQAIDSLIETKLLRKESYQQNYLVEISHDALVEPVVKSLESRQAKEDKLEAKKKLQETEETLLAKEKRLRTQNYAITVLIVSLIIGAALIGFSYWKVRSMEKESGEKIAENEKRLKELDAVLKAKQKEVDSATTKANQSLLNYLKTINNETAPVNTDPEMNKADSALRLMLADSHNKSDTLLKIQYFKNNIDNISVWLILKSLGYKKFSDLPSFVSAEAPNGIFYDYRTKLYDLKIITLALIKSGIKLRRVAEIDKPSSVQIFTRKYLKGEEPSALTVSEIMAATKASGLKKGDGY